MTKPIVFSYKEHEELRQAYKDLLEDNAKLMADNKKLRKDVDELKRTNEGYTKVLAKSQETANRFIRLYMDDNEIVTFPDGKTRRVRGVPHAEWKRGSLVYHCSECGSVSLFETAFCSECGAIMDGGKK